MSESEVARIAALEVHLQHVRDDLAEVRKSLDQVTDILNRWKGIAVALLAIGGAIGWAADTAHKLFGRT